ncbi:MAG: CDP-alcohol phosphatidyltransferase family protein [Sphingomonas sp.]|nr:CDP-alcohol phosphatidyltransferase family protein [Sphingomonas sp.]
MYGLTPAERLGRQWGECDGPVLVASACAVLGETALNWLRENPAIVLATDGGRPVAVAVVPSAVDAAARLIASGDPGMNSVRASQVGDVFVRKLRRRDRLFVRSLEEEAAAKVEKCLFDTVYKGITDLVTKYVWPLPAFWVTKLCARARVPPNAVTFVGMAAMLGATVFWIWGDLVVGMVLAWLMTFLDTVDGKLARVTATSSELGNKLDHVTDVIHPPIWWAALAYALAERQGDVGATLIWQMLGIILIGYVVGRIVESRSKKRFGFNPFLWRPFDSAFRTIISRRNIILLIMTAGLIAGAPHQAFVVAGAWTLVSVAIQLARLIQGLIASRRGPLTSWLV